MNQPAQPLIDDRPVSPPEPETAEHEVVVVVAVRMNIFDTSEENARQEAKSLLAEIFRNPYIDAVDYVDE